MEGNVMKLKFFCQSYIDLMNARFFERMLYEQELWIESGCMEKYNTFNF